MEKLEKSHSVDVRWRSFELRPKDAPPISPEYRARIEAARPRLYQTARESYGLEMNPGPFGFDSRPALTGAKFAEHSGHGPAYHAAVMRAYWQEGRDIEDRTVLAEVAVGVGLEREEFLEALDEDTFQQAVLGDVALAQAYGLSGVPAIVFAEKYLVSGAQPYDVLVQVTEQVQAETAEG
ncbi:MAG: thioredoxin domain-containing protein [Caldilineaceae bacterium]|nr:thioredoxin domain-containing protein [Caldilineaceae bacterium]